MTALGFPNESPSNKGRSGGVLSPPMSVHQLTQRPTTTAT